MIVTTINDTNPLPALVTRLRALGQTRQEAEQIARLKLEEADGLAPGMVYDGVQAEGLPTFWRRAFAHGRRSITLELTAEGNRIGGNLFTVTVLEASNEHRVETAPLSTPADEYSGDPCLEAGKTFEGLPLVALGKIWTLATTAGLRQVAIAIHQHLEHRVSVRVFTVMPWAGSSQN